MNIFNKTIILIVSLIFAFPVLAQKIKVKKDIIYIDKVEIPIKVDSEYLSTKGGISGDFHQVLTFSDATTSENFIIVDHIGKMTNVGGVKEVWFEISDVSKTKTNSVDFDREFGGGKKGIIKHLLNKYQFFTKEGSIDKDKISAFLLTSTTSTTKEKANKAIANNTEIEAKVTEINPFVQNDLTTITKGGRLGTEVIGHLTSPDKYHDTRTTPIKVYDLDDNMIASATTDILSPVTVSLIGGASFEYKSKTQLNGGISNQRFLTELLENLIRKGKNNWLKKT